MRCRYTIIRFIATEAKSSNAKRSKEGISTDIGYHMINLGLFLPCDQDRHKNRKCPMKYLERNKHKHSHQMIISNTIKNRKLRAPEQQTVRGTTQLPWTLTSSTVVSYQTFLKGFIKTIFNRILKKSHQKKNLNSN